MTVVLLADDPLAAVPGAPAVTATAVQLVRSVPAVGDSVAALGHVVAGRRFHGGARVPRIATLQHQRTGKNIAKINYVSLDPRLESTDIVFRVNLKDSLFVISLSFTVCARSPACIYYACMHA